VLGSDAGKRRGKLGGMMMQPGGNEGKLLVEGGPDGEGIGGSSGAMAGINSKVVGIDEGVAATSTTELTSTLDI
jgi:hypothetical protein